MKLFCLVLLMSAGAVGWADVVRLKDGTQLQGDIKKSESGWTVTDEAGRVTQVPADSVEAIQPTTQAAGAESAEAQLASLRRSVENLSDLELILSKYQRFIEQNANSPLAEQARNDLATWQDRLDRKMTKVGSQWVTTQERAALREQSTALAAQAAELLRQAQLAQAEPLVQQSVEIDPGNPVAIYVQGVLLFRQNKLPAARKSFEAVSELAPQHGATLNNLAVINWSQKHEIAAMNFYDRAMQAWPADRNILDNVAEALHALPKKEQDNPVAQRVAKRFQEQDPQLQTDLEARGLFRWGATWVTREKLDELKEAEAKIQEELDALAEEFADAENRIVQIEDDIESNERSMRQISASRAMRTADGKVIRLRLPSVYYELKRDNERLELEREDLLKDLDALRAEAQQVQAELPLPPYTGAQKLIGPEAAPLEAPPAAAETPPAGARAAPAEAR